MKASPVRRAGACSQRHCEPMGGTPFAGMNRWVALIWAGMLSGLAVNAAEDTSFRTEILPILTKAGCNTGACHGAAVGQGGFRLSLLGYDPEEDHFRITREFAGRRVDVETPHESLLLRMARGELDHEGGRRLRRDSTGHIALAKWIGAGAPLGQRDLAVKSVTVTPENILCARSGERAQLQVMAELTNGTRKDVTALALYTSNDEAMAEVGKDGAVKIQGRGLTSVMVRYGGVVAAARIAVPINDEKTSDPEFPAENYIDKHVLAALQRLRTPASPPSSDAEFLRRIYLDLTGRLPDAEEARTLLTGRLDAAGRTRLIDRLLASDSFIDLWTMRLADLLLISGGRGSEEATRTYHHWLREQVAKDRPWNEVAVALLTANGQTTQVGPANFQMLANDPRDLGEHVARIFMGSQIGCARCHAHPADRWTQDDYHRFAAHFARIGRERGAIQGVERGEVDHPKSGKPVLPKPLGEPVPTESVGDRRAQLAAWLTSKSNPFFARAFVNRVWKDLLGRGLIEPVDDMRPTNPPTHPELLDALAEDFVANGFSVRHLIRTIVTSRTYQLTSRSIPGNRNDDVLYSHARLKALSAQVFADSVSQATSVSERFDGHSEGTRAVQLIGTQVPSYTLDVLGRCSRKASCDTPGRSGGGMAQALHLINGGVISDKVRSGILGKLLAENLPDERIIEELYLRSLTRFPSAEELAEWKPVLSSAANKREVLEDLFWSLLNSREFAFNH